MNTLCPVWGEDLCEATINNSSEVENTVTGALRSAEFFTGSGSVADGGSL